MTLWGRLLHTPLLMYCHLVRDNSQTNKNALSTLVRLVKLRGAWQLCNAVMYYGRPLIEHTHWLPLEIGQEAAFIVSPA